MFRYHEDSRLLWFNSDSFEAEAEFELVGILLGVSERCGKEREREGHGKRAGDVVCHATSVLTSVVSLCLCVPLCLALSRSVSVSLYVWLCLTLTLSVSVSVSVRLLSTTLSS